MTTPEEIREFKLSLSERKVRIDGRVFTIRELTGKQRNDYMSHMGSKMKFQTDKRGRARVTGITDIGGADTKLLSLSLRDEQDQPVPEPVILGWPAQVVTDLAAIARELSGLEREEEEDEEAKND